MHKGKIIDRVSGYDVIECAMCGFSHIMPIPAPQDLNKVYQEEYYTAEKPQFIERQIEDIDWWNTVYDDRYDFFEKHLPDNRRKILDIGCGPGFFLKRGKERGWSCFGIEPSKQAAAYATGLGVEVQNCFLSEAELEKEKELFDVVHLSEVLEHIPDPISLCSMAYTLLKKDGLICVVVPNDYNPFQKILRDKMGFQPYWLAPPHHINYFNYDSLEKLLKNVGFTIKERVAMFPMDMFLLMGDNYVGNDVLGRQCHARRKRLDIVLNDPDLKTFKQDLYRLMAHHGIGREMIVFGVKNR